jgi:SAM-dependent methyltransferase
MSSLPKSPPTSYESAKCRLCASNKLEFLFSLAQTPPAEWYFPAENANATSRCFPLDLFFCQDCSHVQLTSVIDPRALFKNYFYETKTSPGLEKHFQNYAENVANNIALSQGGIVVDIGSNDGTLLNEFRKLGFKVVGVEPSAVLAEKVNKSGIKTYNEFLNMTVVEQIVSDYGCASLVTANNVFAHNDDLRGMADCVSKLLQPDGVFVFEVSSVLHTLDGMVFDYIYHEHLSYHSLISLIPFLAHSSLKVYDVEFIETKGGSYRIYAKKTSELPSKTSRLCAAIEKEQRFGLDRAEFYQNKYAVFQNVKAKLGEYLNSLPQSSVIVGYGASATVTTLVYEFSLIDKIEYLVDDNHIRHGCFLPGTMIQVGDPSILIANPPTHVIILAWRFADVILGRIANLLPSTVQYIIPLPDLKIFFRKVLE